MKFTLPWSVCRICMQKGKLFSIFTKDADDSTIADKIMLIGDIEVIADKRLPQEICKKCAILLNTAYTFRMQCKKSHYILQLFLDEDRKKKQQTKNEPKEHTVMTLNNGKVYTVPKGVTLKSSSSTATKQDMASTVLIKKPASGIMTTAGKIIKLPKGILVKYPVKSSLPLPSVSKVNDIDQNLSRVTNTNFKLVTNNELDSITVSDDDMLEDGDATENKKLDNTGPECDDNLSLDCQSNDLEIIEETIDDVENDEYMEDATEENEEEELPSNDEKSQLNDDEQSKDESPVINIVITAENPFEKIFKKKIIYVQKNRNTFICELCGNAYRSKTGFDVHMRGHRNEKPFECELCGVAFTQSSKLTAHMRRHTGEKPYKCNYCDRKFFQNESKLKHERIHTGEKPYECDICGKSFAYACVLSRHKLLHTNENEKNFICPQCGKRFRFKYHLKAHLKTSLHQGS